MPLATVEPVLAHVRIEDIRGNLQPKGGEARVPIASGKPTRK